MHIYQFKDKARFLSNFHLCCIPYQGVIYSSVENAYVAQKSKSQEEKTFISLLEPPGKAKRHVTRFPVDKKWWEENKINVMRELIDIKFSAENPDLVALLVDTWPLELAEGNDWGDRFWGVCPPVGGTGRNELGKLLMQRRKRVMGR